MSNDISERFKFRPQGIPLEEANLPESFVTVLKSLAYFTVEQLYGMMMGSPEVARPFLREHGLDYDQLAQQLRALLSPEEAARLEKPVDTKHGMGALDPKDRPKPE